jgi:hypothetical protein
MKDNYQDHWVKGEVVFDGRREMEERYGAIKEVLSRVNYFTLVDIGANAGYFSFRIASDNNCEVLAIEGDPVYYEDLERLHELNGLPNMKILQKHFHGPEELETFDVALCLSVFHEDTVGHLKDMKQVADLIIYEQTVDYDGVEDLDEGILLLVAKIGKKGKRVRPIRLFSRHFDKFTREFPGSKILEFRGLSGGRCSIVAEIDGIKRFVKIQSSGETSAESKGMKFAKSLGIKVPDLITTRNGIIVQEYIDGRRPTAKDDVLGKIREIQESAPEKKIPSLKSKILDHARGVFPEMMDKCVEIVKDMPDVALPAHGDCDRSNILINDDVVFVDCIEFGYNVPGIDESTYMMSIGKDPPASWGTIASYIGKLGCLCRLSGKSFYKVAEKYFNNMIKTKEIMDGTCN